MAYSTWVFQFYPFRPDVSFAQITSEDSLYTVALGAYKNGFLDLAIDQFQKFLELYPRSQKVPFAWFRLGEAYRTQNKDSLSIEAYQKILDLFPDHKLTHITLFRLAGVRFRQKDYSSAILDYNRLLKEAPSSNLAKESRFWIAESLYQLKKYPEALSVYRTYITDTINGKFVSQAIYGAGWCLMELGRYAEAGKQFKELLDRNLSDEFLLQVHLGLGDALFEQKDYKGALAHYSKYAKGKSEDQSKIIIKYGFVLSYLGRDEDAIRIFQDFLEKAPKDNPEVPEVLFRLGQIFYRHKRYQESVDTFMVIEKRYPNQSMIPEVVFQIGLGYFNMNKTASAKQYLQKSIKLLSDQEKTAIASLYLGNIHYQEGQMKEAADFYLKAKKTKDLSLFAEVAYRLAESLFGIGEHEKALQELESIVSSVPDQLLWIQMAKFRLGNIYEQKGDSKLALRFYVQVSQMKDGAKDLSQAAQDRIKAIKDAKENEQEREKMNEKTLNIKAREN